MRKDNVDLICDIAELAGLFERSSSLDDFLDTVTQIIAWHMKAAVCSIYLFEEETQTLVLRATQGLDKSAVGEARLRLGEGITGLAMKELRPICEARGSKNPHFKYLPEILEDQFEAFLAVPILRGLARIGVLVVQDPQPHYFDQNDVKALRAIAGQLATTLENAKLFLSLHGAPISRATTLVPLPRLLRGKPASDGIAIGRGSILSMIDEEALRAFDSDLSPRTLDDFHRALKETERQLSALQKKLEEDLSDVASLIFSAHLLILKDASFSGTIIQAIEKGTPPHQAISEVVNQYIEIFARSSNERLREKVLDVKDLGHRLLLNLMSHDPELADYEGSIIIAREILPSQLFKLASQRAAGIILLSGNLTSHISILARSLNIPTLLIDDAVLLERGEGLSLILDAVQGTLLIDPDDEVLTSYRKLIEERNRLDLLEPEVQASTHTRDGVRIRLYANINLLSDLTLAKRWKAEGIGLYRSEIPFIVRDSFPSEEEQFRIYRRLLEEMNGHSVTLRTLDIGGDKMLSYMPNAKEANPFLGLRAIRFSLRNPAIFTQQLRAMLRAGAGTNIRIMFPFISSTDEYLQAREMVYSCIDDLAHEDLPHNAKPALGMMIELPSAVELIDELCHEADFISIGTNDLIQYLLAVDRTNELISDLYLPHHPAVLRALFKVGDAACRHGVEVSVCGDVATDVKLIPFLLGCGIHTLSLDSRHIPAVQSAVEKTDMAQARESAREMVKLSSISEVAAYLGIEPSGS